MDSCPTLIKIGLAILQWCVVHTKSWIVLHHRRYSTRFFNKYFTDWRVAFYRFTVDFIGFFLTSPLKRICLDFWMSGGRTGCTGGVEPCLTSLSGVRMAQLDLQGRLGVTVCMFALNPRNILHTYNCGNIMFEFFISWEIFLARSVLCHQI